jgi:hypothetical protein
MKKVLKPAEYEDAIYYSDFSGKLLNETPPIEIVVDFNYGSKYDGCKLELHLNDEDFDQLLNFLKTKLSEDFKHNYEQFK